MDAEAGAATVEGAAGLAPCARCARVQRTCCQRAEILVTEGDLGRIAAFVGRERAERAWSRRVPADPAYLDDDPDDPAWLALSTRPDGTRRLLERRPDGDCTFLGAEGCRLPLEVRPLVCRLYPFAYTERGLEGVDPEYCPTALLAPDGRAMDAVLGIDAADARRWHGMLYRELHDGTP